MFSTYEEYSVPTFLVTSFGHLSGKVQSSSLSYRGLVVSLNGLIQIVIFLAVGTQFPVSAESLLLKGV